MMKTYRTDFENKSGSRIFVPLFIDGSKRITLDRGTPEKPFTGCIEQGKECLYAPYKKITYQKDGRVKATKRSGFRFGKMDFPTLIENDSKIPTQMLKHQKGTVYIPQGIQTFFEFGILDPQCEYITITFTEPQPTGEFRLSVSGMGEPMQIPKVLDIWKVRRKDKELLRLKEARMKVAEQEHQKDLESEDRRELRRLRLREEAK